ncbi:MAG: hypothetical protein AB7T06_06455 [Kofleriaceae bacterium]
MSTLTRSVGQRPDRRILRGAVVGIASGFAAGTLYAAITPDIALGAGAAVGIAAGAVAGILHALLDKLIR